MRHAALLHADTARNRLVGIGLVSLAYLHLAALDAGAKWLVGLGTMPVVIVVWLRFLTQALIASAVLLPLRGIALVRTQHLRWHVLRALFFLTMTALNFWALRYLQLAVTSSIQFSTPIIIALLAAPMLGERLDAGRWCAIVAGFAGVLAIVRPWSVGFHPAIFLSITNAILYAGFMLMTRRLAAYDSPETIQYLPAVGATLGLAPFALAAWDGPDSPLEWMVACLLGAIGGAGHYLLALAHRYAPATVIAPFLYQQVLYAGTFGYLLFGDVPAVAVWLGAAIVIASGLYLFWRERARR